MFRGSISRIKNRQGGDSIGNSRPRRVFQDYTGKPRLRVTRKNLSSEPVIKQPADPEKVKAYREREKEPNRDFRRYR